MTKTAGDAVATHANTRRILWQGVLLSLLAATSCCNYLLFHSLAELYAIVIAAGIFIIAWTARAHYHNDYLLFIGIAYLFVAGFDTLHMLGYHGMAVFSDLPGYNLGPQLWLVGRTLEAGTLLLAPRFTRRPLPLKPVFAGYGLISALALWSIFGARNFPLCFSPETGLTLFKVVAEYVIVALLLAALTHLVLRRKTLDRQVYRLLFASILLTIASELCFTLYISHYGPANLLGHLLKIVSFTLIYFAIIDTALRRPFALLFRDLKEGRDSLLAAQRAAKLGSWSWRPETQEMRWSEETYRLLGQHEKKSPPGFDSLVAALDLRDRNDARQALEAARHGGSLRIEVRRGDSGEAPVHLRIEGDWELDGDGAPLLAGIVQDISEAVAAEELRREIDGITRHDLRTPLTPIIGIAEVLALTGKNLTDDQRDMLEDIRLSGVRMLDLINRSLTLYKIERGNYQLQPEAFDLLDTLREVLRESAERAAAGGVTCRLEPAEEAGSRWIIGERLLCHTLFANLIGNAVEASPPGETVVISVTETAENWRVSIDNSGEVPESFRPRFFEKYATHGKKGGTGLGTYSAMMAARAHGGTILLHCQAGRTTLTVVLPTPPPNSFMSKTQFPDRPPRSNHDRFSSCPPRAKRGQVSSPATNMGICVIP